MMKCEKCGKEIDCLLVNMFDHEGADSFERHFLTECEEDAAYIETSQNWTGYELSEEEMRDTIVCPHCKQFPFKNGEIQVYDIVRVVCFKHQTDAICEYRTQDGQCLKHSDDVVRSFCVDGPCPDETHSNADRIRAMNDDELAEFLSDFESGIIEYEQWHCDMCLQKAHAEQRKVDCMDCLKKWLQQPAKDGD